MARFCTRENEPLKKWNGIPIYLTTILTAVLVVGFIFSAILLALKSPLFFDLMFRLPGSAWNFVGAFTYPLIDYLNFFTPFGILFFYQFSVGIETHLGRAVLSKLLLLLLFVPVTIAAISWYGFGISAGYYGNSLLTAGLIIAFATLYPKLEAFSWVPFKWLAFVCLIAGSLIALADRQWLVLIALWASAGAGFAYIRHCLDEEYDDSIPWKTRIRGWFRRKPKLRAMPPPIAPRRPSVPSISEETDTEVDALLDKIAKSGLSSLTSTERAKLERARQALLKKEHD